MPNFFAHLYFGQLVLNALPARVRRAVAQEQRAYALGQLGPDPLFFYRLFRKSQASGLGRALHHQPMETLLPRMAQAIEARAPFALGYSAGFVCHFALDSRCHAYITEQARGSRLLHTAIETEFDRFLMERQGLDPARQTPMPPISMPDAFYDTLSTWFYPGAEAEGYRQGLFLYNRLVYWHTKCAARNVIPLGLAAAAHWLPGAALIRDMAVKRSPGPAFDRHDQKLLKLLEGEVLTAAEQLELFLQGHPPAPWFRRDFHGVPREPPDQ